MRFYTLVFWIIHVHENAYKQLVKTVNTEDKTNNAFTYNTSHININISFYIHIKKMVHKIINGR